MEPTHVKIAPGSQNFLNRYQSGKYPFFRAFDILLLLVFSCFVIYCLTPSNAFVKGSVIAKPSGIKPGKSAAIDGAYFSLYNPKSR